MMIRKGRLRWLGHVERMPEERNVKKEYKNIQEEKMSFGKPRKRWLGDDESDLKKISVRTRRKLARGRDEWKVILKEAKVLYVP
jgi:hypothetical protein